MENKKITYEFNVNSFHIKAEYYEQDINDIFIPLVGQLGKMREHAGRRLIVYLAGPCGAGKTTLSLLLESLAHAHTENSAQAVGIDGFHYGCEYLSSHYISRNGDKILMQNIKGSAETYDFEKLHGKIASLKHADISWSGYDRTIHDVVENVSFIDGQIVIIEGNWLLLNEPPWRELVQFCDYSIFVDADRETLISWLVERKIMGGLSAEQAREFVLRSDAENIERILNRRLRCNLKLQMKEDGSFI